MMRKLFTYLFRAGLLGAVVALCWPMQSCRDEFRHFREGDVVLEFSQDTVRFDTLFTGFASSTQRVMVRNPYKEAVRISRIYLSGGTLSPFRINVGGNTDLFQSDVVLAARDSLYVFVNLYIDYANSNYPLEVSDAICFEVEQNPVQKVVLSAWGQDVNIWRSDGEVRVPFYDPGLFNPDEDSLTLPYFLYDEAVHRFDDPKPYVIYGYLTVPEGKTLEIPSGTRIFFGPQSGIWVRKGARLRITGTLGAPVYMTSLRQDGDYRNTAGQWGRIWLDAESGPHEVDYAFLRNGQTGFWLDSCTAGGAPGWGAAGEGGLTVRNTRIENMSSYAIFSRQNRVLGENLCCARTGSALGLFQGGNYEFTHCTFHNDYSWGWGGSRGLWLSDYESVSGVGVSGKGASGAGASGGKGALGAGASGGKVIYPLEKARFANCCFSGSSSQQLYIDLAGEAASYPQILFDYCLVTVSPAEPENPWFDSCVWNEEPLFAASGFYDFTPDSLSPLTFRGNPVYVRGTCLYDLGGRQRPVPPCIGAWEFFRSF